MPGFDEQRAAQSCTMPPEILAQIHQRRGDIMGAGPQAMSQVESVLAARVADLVDEVRELRRMLAPPSAVILTGSEVARQFSQLASIKGGVT